MDSEQRRARRETQRRRRARRRAWGLAAVVLAVAAALLVVLGLAGGSSSSPPARDTARKGAGGSTGASTRSHARHAAASAHSRGGSSSAAALRVGAPRAVAVPILMYHVINPPPADAKFPGLYVPPDEFAEQMHALAHAGFHAVTMDQMLAHWNTDAPLPAGKPIVVSFDNGYQSQLTKALPVLRTLGWVGVENIQLTGLPPSQGGLSEAQVAQLVSAGWELDTQGISHADLITLGPAALREQVALAREEVKRRYHVPVNWFCYPSGHYDATVIAEVKAAGFVGSTTVVPGWARPTDDPYRLPRLRVLGGTSAQSLLAEIAAIRSNPSPPASYGGA
jgi:peptidoglycan/xylan/chitin deacetylase (PgdA/CDA1 family)